VECGELGQASADEIILRGWWGYCGFCYLPGDLIMNYNEALNLVIKPGLRLLPEKFDTPEARVLMLAIGMQESRFLHRRQINGPARGFFQFEKGGGVKGVLNHPATKTIVYDVLDDIGIHGTDALTTTCYECLSEPEHDPLAAVFARLLLYTHPKKLPSLTSDPDESWKYYVDTWRPGKPHRHTFDAFLMHARRAVNDRMAR
jgi:hypothetical protein